MFVVHIVQIVVLLQFKQPFPGRIEHKTHVPFGATEYVSMHREQKVELEQRRQFEIRLQGEQKLVEFIP